MDNFERNSEIMRCGLAEAYVLFYSKGNYEELGGYSRIKERESGGMPQKIARTNTSRFSDKSLCNKEYSLFY